MTFYDNSSPHGVNKNAMTFLGQSRDSWPFIAALGEVELTEMQKILERKNKNEILKKIRKYKRKNKYENENENE